MACNYRELSCEEVKLSVEELERRATVVLDDGTTASLVVEIQCETEVS